MTLARVRWSLQTKLLIAVVVCALVPLAAVGAWLSSSAVRSGELLLRTQLDSSASRSAATIQQRWEVRKSDVLMLAASIPVRASLANPSMDTAPEYARRAFATTTGLASVELHDKANRIRWRLAHADPASGSSTYSMNDTRRIGFGSSAPTSSALRAPVTDDANRAQGEIEAQIRFDALLPTVTMVELAPSQFLAYRDRVTGAQAAPAGVPPAAFNGEHFTWNDHRWLAVRERLDDPPIDVVAAAQLDLFLSPFTRTARTGALALVLVAAIVIVLTIVVTNRLTRSLGELALAADQVSHGALGTRVRDTPQDEVGRVGRAFNSMLENIARMMRELSQREAVAAMGELAATMAHQVRSPATAMRIDVQRAHDKLPAESTERALLSRALGQLDRMERAIDASLKLARASRTEFGEVDVREILGRAATGVRREQTTRSATIDMSGVPSELPRVRGDAASLEQLFANVIINAAQASENGGAITLLVEANGGPSIDVSVCDHGAGMSPEVLARAGEPLFSTKPEGTGLGLAIARRIAAAHGGTLSIESDSGSGTTVRVRLPRVF
jgi:signal transduction histidine kinase